MNRKRLLCVNSYAGKNETTWRKLRYAALVRA